MSRKVFIHSGGHAGKEGVFHQFGISFEECEKGIGHFTTAIIELKSGDVLDSVPAGYIKFIRSNEVVL
jgi:hypothetical protein